MPSVIFISLFILIFTATVAFFLGTNKQRTKEIKALAKELDFQFYPEGRDRLPPLLTQLDFFVLGKYKRVHNLMMGQLPKSNGAISVAIFDYSFTIGVKEDTKTFCQSVVLFFVRGMDLPQFRLSPEQGLNKIGYLIGFRNINFPQYPRFSQKYCLLCNQEEWVRKVFHLRIIDFLEEEDFCAEANGNYLVLYPTGQGILQQHTVSMQNGQDYAENRFLQPEEIPLFLETSTTFLKLLHGHESCWAQS